MNITPTAIVTESAISVSSTYSAITTNSAFTAQSDAYLYDIRSFVFYIFVAVFVYIVYRLVRSVFL